MDANIILEQKIGYVFKQKGLLTEALTHRSFRNERGNEQSKDNEKLEFLGDAVVDLALSNILYRRFPNDNEGALSKKRASLVNEDALSDLALQLQIEKFLRLGKGERQSGGLKKPRLLASALEGVFGAMFLDSNYEEVEKFVIQLFESKISEMSLEVDYESDYKTRLQERIQEMYRITPVYVVDEETGPDHDKVFCVSVKMGDKVLAQGTGKSKKTADQSAARIALENLGEKK